MKVTAKCRGNNRWIKGTLTTATKGMSNARCKSLGLHPRELIIVADRTTYPFYGKGYELQEMTQILKRTVTTKEGYVLTDQTKCPCCNRFMVQVNHPDFILYRCRYCKESLVEK